MEHSKVICPLSSVHLSPPTRAPVLLTQYLPSRGALCLTPSRLLLPRPTPRQTERRIRSATTRIVRRHHCPNFRSPSARLGNLPEARRSTRALQSCLKTLLMGSSILTSSTSSLAQGYGRTMLLLQRDKSSTTPASRLQVRA